MSVYAVKKGIVPGVYNTWNECLENTKGFSGAEFHKFKTIEEAEEWINDGKSIHRSNKDVDLNQFDKENILYPCAFIDGSYNPTEKIYGYGLFLQYQKDGNVETKIEKKSGNDSELLIMRNIAGELLSALAVVKLAISLNLEKIHIYYDYTGIEMWGRGLWNTKNKWIKENYIKKMQEYKKDIEIIFIKTPAHIGIEGNEMADKLAKEAVGL